MPRQKVVKKSRTTLISDALSLSIFDHRWLQREILRTLVLWDAHQLGGSWIWTLGFGNRKSVKCAVPIVCVANWVTQRFLGRWPCELFVKWVTVKFVTAPDEEDEDNDDQDR